MINEVETAFGRPFLSYVLAADQLDIGFSTPQQEVLDVLQQFVDAANEHEEPFGRLNILEHAARFRPDFGMSQANALRVYCGGELPDVDDASALITSLLTAAPDVYPLFLIPTPEGMPITGPTGAYSHPESEEFSRHALRDESLSRLFPGAPSALGTTRRDLDSVHSDILWSDGQGGGLQLNSVLPALLEAAYRLYVLNKKDTATEYLQYTKLILQEAQALARGDTVEVPYIIGLSNISLGSDGQLNLAFGRITPPDPSALRLITRGTQSIEQRISAVLHASFPLRLLDIKPWDPTQSNHTEEEEKLLSRLSEYRRAADRRIDLSRFALLLTSRETLIGTPIVLSAILLPVSQGSSFGVNIASNAPVPPVILDGDMVREAESWSHKLAANQPHSLDVGMRRLLSAVTMRFDPADGLVDAVICWENIFGTAQETRFRVCGAMAKILEPTSPANRGQLNKELKRIYDVRSKLVHGSHKLPGPREAAGDRDKALLYALDSIRKLHGRPDLLAITDSADRSTTLLLDLAPAQKE